MIAHVLQQSVINDIKLEDIDIIPSDDRVFHISEAIMARAFELDDKKLMSGEKELKGLSGKRIACSIFLSVNAAKSNIKSMPFSALSNFDKN